MAAANNYPKLHNAMWPGLVGKGPDSEPPIDLDTMIDLTAKAEVGGVKFDGIDIFHAAPHTNIDFTDDEAKQLAGPVDVLVSSLVQQMAEAIKADWGPGFI